MINRIHHLCYAVFNMDRAIASLAELYGMQAEKRIIMKERKMEAALFKLEHGYFEILAPLSNNCDLFEHLLRRGEGFHHVAFGFDDMNFLDHINTWTPVSERKSSVGDWLVYDHEKSEENPFHFQLIKEIE